MKTPKTISISRDIFEDVKKRTNTVEFNFSKWVSKRYKEEFMSISKKEEEIKEKEVEINLLKEEIELIKAENNTQIKEIPQLQQRFLVNVPILISEGKDIKAILTRFNSEFGREWSINKFKTMIEVFKKQNEAQKAR